MPGMNPGLSTASPLLLAAFRSALLQHGMIALLGLAVLGLVLVSLRQARRPLARGAARAAETAAGSGRGQATPGDAGPGGPAAPPWRTALRMAGRRVAADGSPEPSWRAVLRMGFGLLWIVDGILQAQPAMVAGLPSQIIGPAAASSPAWVRHLDNWAGLAWAYHPVQAAAAAVWIQIGIGCWMLAARHGRWSRLAALAGVAWGVVIWA